jgi:hypothetical protein
MNEKDPDGSFSFVYYSNFCNLNDCYVYSLNTMLKKFERLLYLRWFVPAYIRIQPIYTLTIKMSEIVSEPTATLIATPTEVVAVSEPAKKVYVCKICKKPGHISSNRAFHPPPTASTEDKAVDELASLFSNLETASTRSESEADSASESELSESPDAENTSKDRPRSEHKMATKKPVKNSKKTSCPEDDTYTPEVLREQYGLHKDYVIRRKESAKRLGIKFRLPSIPEDISENMMKFMIHRMGDKTSRWNCSADLLSDKEGKQECKCFTSDGPISFTPSSHWGIIYFLDARKWLENKYILWRVDLKRTSDEWKNIKVNSTTTFEKQVLAGRRPRIPWKLLLPQIADNCVKVFEGGFEDIFTPPTPTPTPKLRSPVLRSHSTPTSPRLAPLAPLAPVAPLPLSEDSEEAE